MNSPSPNRRIRIAYILPTEVRGGVEEHVLSLVKGIDRGRFEVFLVAPSCLADSLEADLSPGEATIIRLRISSLRDFGAMWEYFRFLRANRIDIVNTHMFIATFYYGPLARLAGVPILLETTHLLEKWRLGKGFFRKHSFVIDRLFYKLVTKVLAVSHACKEDLRKIKGVDGGKIVVVQNGRDLSSFDPSRMSRRSELRVAFGYTDEDLVFGVFARLNHQKGHRYLIEALHILKGRGARAKVIFVGDGELRRELRDLAERFSVLDQIVFAGFSSAVPEMLGMVDVKVLPSLYEGLPLCVIEALAMGKPVIATTVDGTPEVFVSGVHGLLVPPRDPEALADALEFALNNRERMAAMGSGGRDHVARHFTLQRQVDETEAVYLRLHEAATGNGDGALVAEGS